MACKLLIMSEEVDYSRLTIDELDDVARHVDRIRYPEVAQLVDSEMRRRIRSGESVHESFAGGGYLGATTVRRPWPMMTLRFNRDAMTLRSTFFGVPLGEVTLARRDVIGFRRPWNGFLEKWFGGGGFEILHNRSDVESYLVFESPSERRVIDSLRDYGWPVSADW